MEAQARKEDSVPESEPLTVSLPLKNGENVSERDIPCSSTSSQKNFAPIECQKNLITL